MISRPRAPVWLFITPFTRYSTIVGRASADNGGRRLAGTPLETITDAAYRLDAGGVIGILLDLFTQSVDMDIHRTAFTGKLIAPDLLNEVFSGQYFVSIEGQ